MSDKQLHLELIQGVINRLAHDSFLIKGWSIVLISAMFALSTKDADITLVFLAYFPTMVFWGLDGFFLRQERLFRRLYDHVRILSEDNIDYSMNTNIVKSDVGGWLSVTLSKTLIPFYFVVATTILFVATIVADL